MEIEKGFRYLVDTIQIGSHTYRSGPSEVKFLEITETAFKIKIINTGIIYWILNEWDFEIIERLEDYEDTLYSEDDVLNILYRFTTNISTKLDKIGVKIWFDENKKFIDQ